MTSKHMTAAEYLQRSVADRMLNIYSAYGIRATKSASIVDTAKAGARLQQAKAAGKAAHGKSASIKKRSR